MTTSPSPTDSLGPDSLDPDLVREPRLVVTTRRSLMVRGALAGVAVAMPLLAACGTGDAEALAGASGQTAVVASDTVASNTAVSDAATSVFPAGAELVVDFTYTSSDSGQSRNPYIAVWVEDAGGNLVDTISLWYKQGKGEKWLDDLQSWYAASDGGSDLSMSGATRVAGSYTVAWDGTDLDGNPVAQGDYTLYIESAREHGPHELTSTTFTVGDEAFAITLADQGEISAASAELVLA